MLTIFGGNLLRQWGIKDRRTELCKWAQPSDVYDVVASQQGGCVDSRQWDAFHPMNIQNDTSSRFYNRLQGVYYAVVESRWDSTRRGVCVCVCRQVDGRRVDVVQQDVWPGRAPLQDGPLCRAPGRRAAAGRRADALPRQDTEDQAPLSTAPLPRALARRTVGRGQRPTSNPYIRFDKTTPTSDSNWTRITYDRSVAV